MARRIYVITNVTGGNAQFTNTEASGDSCTVNTGTIVHTGGSDGDYCTIPNCTGAQNFQDHHMSVSVPGLGLTINFWKNSDQNDLLYYNSGAQGYNDGVQVPRSDAWLGVSMLVKLPFEALFFQY